MIGGQNAGPGRGHGIRLTRAEALEFVALAALRAYGVTLAQIEHLARELRRQGKHGAGFFDAGGLGRRALLDGAGPTAPLRELSGQAFLFPFDLLDLRPLRDRAERFVDQLTEQGTAHAVRG